MFALKTFDYVKCNINAQLVHTLNRFKCTLKTKLSRIIIRLNYICMQITIKLNATNQKRAKNYAQRLHQSRSRQPIKMPAIQPTELYNNQSLFVVDNQINNQLIEILGDGADIARVRVGDEGDKER
jgi:hypothetical protein